MLHLFNKVYLEFDNKINVDLDRVVISDQFGIQMSSEQEKYTYGTLLRFSKSLEELNNDIVFDEFILELKGKSVSTNKKIMVYCDRSNYLKFIASWMKLMMPTLDLDTFKDIANLVIYRERCISNTQLSSQNAVNINSIFNAFTDEDWEYAWDNKIEGQISPTLMGVSISYEFLLANYLAGDRHYVEPLLATAHRFLRRFFQEIFTDNRQMVVLNINNHRFQESLGYSGTVDITGNPLDGIEVLKYYNDSQIWSTPTTVSSGVYGICNLAGLPQEKINGLRNTLFNIYESFEGMTTNTTVFDAFDWLEIACRDEMTQEEFDQIIEFISEAPFDTCVIPRFDFENVNFPLFLHVLRKYHEGDTEYLQKFIIHTV
jgi:hypothetical protein